MGRDGRQIGKAGVACPRFCAEREGDVAALLLAVVIAQQLGLSLRDGDKAQLQVVAVGGGAMLEADAATTEALLLGDGEGAHAVAACGRFQCWEGGHQFCRVMVLMPRLKVAALLLTSAPKST